MASGFARAALAVAVSFVLAEACEDLPDWASAELQTCANYESLSYCTSSGGYGEGWMEAFGTFAEYANSDGVDASEACCACGRRGPTTIPTCGGTADGASCVFPFTYFGTTYEECIASDNDGSSWCYTEADAVQGVSPWGNCECTEESEPMPEPTREPTESAEPTPEPTREPTCEEGYAMGGELCGEEGMCEDECQGMVASVLGSCQGHETYWDDETNENKNIKADLQMIQAMCNDPCARVQFDGMSRGCFPDEWGGGQSCDGECLDVYASGATACSNTPVEDENYTMGRMFMMMSEGCKPCNQAFGNIARNGCFENPCTVDCRLELGEAMEKCGDDDTFWSPEENRDVEMLPTLDWLGTFMDSCTTWADEGPAIGDDDGGCFEPEAMAAEGGLALGQDGGSDCPCGYTFITDHDGCKEAAMHLYEEWRGEFSSTEVPYEEWDGPVGCHAQMSREGGMQFQYNARFENPAMRSPEHILICAREGDTPAPESCTMVNSAVVNQARMNGYQPKRCN